MYHHSFGSDHAAVPRMSDNPLPFGLGLGALGSKLPTVSTSNGPMASHDDLVNHTAPHRQPMSPESASGEMMMPDAPSNGLPRQVLGGGDHRTLDIGSAMVAGLPDPMDRSMGADMDALGSPSSRAAMGSVGCDETAPSPGGMRDDSDAVILDENCDETKGKSIIMMLTLYAIEFHHIHI